MKRHTTSGLSYSEFSHTCFSDACCWPPAIARESEGPVKAACSFNLVCNLKSWFPVGVYVCIYTSSSRVLQDKMTDVFVKEESRDNSFSSLMER